MAVDAELEKMIRELHDKQAIREVIANYSRGIDRRDKETLLSCYHPDALDDHGLFVGGPEDFYEWTDPSHLRYFRTHQHIVTNHTCCLEGTTAHAETYWMFAGMTQGEGKLAIFGGRYVDRLEKREGQWRIAARKCVLEWWGAPTDGMVTPESLAARAGGGKVAKDRTDCSYERPLTVDSRRVGLRLGVQTGHIEITAVEFPVSRAEKGPVGTDDQSYIALDAHRAFAVICGRAHHSPAAITRPLIRRGSNLVPVSWDECLDDIAMRLGNVRDTYGPNAIGFYFGSGLSHGHNTGMFNPAVPIRQRMARRGLDGRSCP